MTVIPVCVRVRLPLLVTQIASEMRVADMIDTSVTEIVGPDEVTGTHEVTGPDEIAEHEDAASAAISDADEPETDDEEASEADVKPKRRKASSDAPKSAAKAATKSSAKSASSEDDMPATPDINVSSAGTGNDEMCEGELVWYNERKR